jgi:hypothetical protein
MAYLELEQHPTGYPYASDTCYLMRLLVRLASYYSGTIYSFGRVSLLFLTLSLSCLVSLLLLPHHLESLSPHAFPQAQFDAGVEHPLSPSWLVLSGVSPQSHLSL